MDWELLYQRACMENDIKTLKYGFSMDKISTQEKAVKTRKVCIHGHFIVCLNSVNTKQNELD
ncbi:hypothetical protein C3766_12215 [Heyndrickxia coagulans]|nr:hypothetical protein C3766_12215 [Heyndrickxia coagulans]AWP37696.1 hypothetical protein CYJ15_12205 [Heyndrickxia coagulans]